MLLADDCVVSLIWRRIAKSTRYYVGAPEILKENGLFSTKASIRGGQPRATPANTNHGEGRTRSNSLPNGEHIEWLGGKRIYGAFSFA